MTGKDRIILQKISTYIDDVTQYIDGFSFENFNGRKKLFPPVLFQFPKLVNWRKKSAGIPRRSMTIYHGKAFEV